VFVSFATLLALAMPQVARAVPTDPEAKAHLERGNAAYGKGDYKLAVEEYRKGYAKQDDPAFLYTWAQAERKRNDCAAAVRLYQRYLATNPPELSAEYARDGILKCAEILAGDAAMPPGADGSSSEDDPTVGPTEPEVTPPEPGRAKSDDRPRWPRDPAAVVLVSLGAIGIVAGAGVMAAGSVEGGKTTDTYGAYDDQLDRVRKLYIGGGVALGLGVGLLVGGVARWMLLRKRETKGGDTQVSAMLGRGTMGLSLTRRF
jgi:tetratricopeptide (TPR) repeat protein